MSVGLDAGTAPAATRDDLWERFLRHRGAVIGATIVTLVVLAAIFAPLLAPHPYDSTSLFESWDPPSAAHPLGADKLGRDIASRLLYGARTSLIVSLAVLAITIVFGGSLGMIAAYFGGRVDRVIMGAVDVVLAFPEVVFAILAAAVIGPGMLTVIVALSLGWSLHGIQVRAPSGSFRTYEPPAVSNQPDGRPTADVVGDGSTWYPIAISASPSSADPAGSTTRTFSGSTAYSASSPSTETESTRRPTASRVTSGRCSVRARATVIVASIRSVAGS